MGKAEEEKNSKDLIKSGVSAAVGGAVSVTKDVVSGVAEGFNEGRKAGESLDGAKVVTNGEEFAREASVRVTKVEDLGKGNYRLTLALKNEGEAPVRLTNLSQDTNVILLDDEDFAYRLPDSKQAGDITILPKSAERVRLEFRDVELRPKTLRLYQIDHALPEPSKADAPTG